MSEAPPSVMKACFYNQWGDKSVLKYGELPSPDPSSGQLLIKVCCAALNPVDFKMREGSQKGLLKFQFPVTTGLDFAGIVQVVGKDNDDYPFKVGDRVFGQARGIRGGSLAEFMAVDASVCAIIPESVSFKDAAAVPLVSVTSILAFQQCPLLKEKKKGEEKPPGNDAPGRRVLITCGAGGVGSHAIQIARALYNVSHIATTASPGEKTDHCKALGADRVIDYRQNGGDWITPLREELEASNELFDMVFDCSGEFVKLPVLLHDKGDATLVSIVRAVTVPAIIDWLDRAKPDNLRFGVETLIRSSVLKGVINWAVGGKAVEAACALRKGYFRPVIGSGDGPIQEKIAQLMESKSLKAIIDSEFELAKCIEAFERIESGKVKGKVVLKIDDQ